MMKKTVILSLLVAALVVGGIHAAYAVDETETAPDQVLNLEAVLTEAPVQLASQITVGLSCRHQCLQERIACEYPCDFLPQPEQQYCSEDCEFEFNECVDDCP